jgi:hypothetical protein
MTDKKTEAPVEGSRKTVDNALGNSNRSTKGREYKNSVSNNENIHEEDDVERPSRASKRKGHVSRQDREEVKDEEKHPER